MTDNAAYLTSEIPIYRQGYYWRLKSRLPERYRQPCWVTARGKLNTIRVEFLDGFVVYASRYAVRKVPE